MLPRRHGGDHKMGEPNMEHLPGQGTPPDRPALRAETSLAAPPWHGSTESKPSLISQNLGRDASPSASLSGTLIKTTANQ